MRRSRPLTLKLDSGTGLPEKSLEMQIVHVLSGLGYMCLVTGFYRTRARCPECGASFWPRGGNGNARGVADILVTRPAWPVGLWAALEVKGARTAISPEQEALAAQGRNVIVRSIAEAIDTLQATERALGLSHPRLERFWEINPRAKLC